MKKLSLIIFLIFLVQVSLFAQLDMTFTKLKDLLGETAEYSVQEYPKYKNVIVYVDSSDVRFFGLKAVKDTIVYIDLWFEPSSSFDDMSNEIEQYDSWKETENSPMEIAELKRLRGDDPLNTHKRFINTDSTAIAYLKINEEYNSSEISIRSNQYYELKKDLVLTDTDRVWHSQNMLIWGYHTNSKDLLLMYMNEWSNKSQPLSYNDRNNLPIINDAYEIFEDAYTPHNLLRFSNPYTRMKVFLIEWVLKLRVLSRMILLIYMMKVRIPSRIQAFS